MQALVATPPRLTLHIEADTLSELMDALDAVMGQINPDHISAIRHHPDRAEVDIDVHGSKQEADTAVAAAAKRGRGRPRKEATEGGPVGEFHITPAPTLAQEAEDEEILRIAAAAAAAAQPDASATMTTLSPADARKRGIEMIQTFFAANPGCLAQVTAISTKFGVSQFADVTDADAHRFLADITLLTNGSGTI